MNTQKIKELTIELTDLLLQAANEDDLSRLSVRVAEGVVDISSVKRESALKDRHIVIRHSSLDPERSARATPNDRSLSQEQVAELQAKGEARTAAAMSRVKVINEKGAQGT